MHPPSPTPPEDGPSSGILHIIQDVRDMSLDDSEVQQNVQSWTQVIKQDARLGPVPKASTASSIPKIDALDPAMAMLSLNDDMDVKAPVVTEGITREESAAIELQNYHPNPPFTTTFADDLHVLFPRQTSDNPIGANSRGSEAFSSPFSSSVSSQTPRSKRQRRRRRVTSGNPANGILSLDYTHRHSTKSATNRRPFYEPMRPPPISSFLRLHTRKRSVSAPHLVGPSHPAAGCSCPETSPPSIPMGYPDYIMNLAENLGDSENVYPLWYLILTFWFPEHEGYEVVNGWTPQAPGDSDGPGCEIALFRPVEATLAVIWRGDEASGRRPQGRFGSPAVVVQISPVPSTAAKTLLEAKRSAERLFGDAALYSELPTLCVLSVASKTVWGGFVRTTDATAEWYAHVLQREVGGWDWFGPSFERGGCHEDLPEQPGGNTGGPSKSNAASTVRGEGKGQRESVVSLEAFEFLGRCFAGMKVNCAGQ